MGYNTSLIIMNDALNEIKDDPNFGKNVHNAVCNLTRRSQIDISSGHHVNAATAIESHHADGTSVVAFGGNRGIIMAEHLFVYGDEPEEERILKGLADKLGYTVKKKT